MRKYYVELLDSVDNYIDYLITNHDQLENEDFDDPETTFFIQRLLKLLLISKLLEWRIYK